MTNPRDTGRYDQFTDATSDTNVRVDFAWGNIPMQPNDDRGMATLDDTLDSHIIATSGYEGFPAFIQGGIYDDTIPNVVVPNILGMTVSQANAALDAAGVTFRNNDGMTTTGATAINDGKISYQSVTGPININETVHYQTYHYVAPSSTTGPISGFNRLPTHFSLNGNQVNMYVVGRTVKPSIGDTISVSGTSGSDWNQNYTVEDVVNDDSYNTGGTAIKLTQSGTRTGETSTGGTWTKL